MPNYHTLGELPRKRHIVLRKPGGGVYQEQVMGNLGFTGPASILYHTYPPTRVKDSAVLKDVTYQADTDTSLRLRHFRTTGFAKGGSPTIDRLPLMFNSDTAMLYCEPDTNDVHFYRNSMGDEYIYISEGEGVLESQFGDLPYKQGDQLIIHRGILYKLNMADVAHKLLIIECRGYLRTPSRYRNEFGQLVEGAPFSERDINCPQVLQTHDELGEFKLVVKQYDKLHGVVLDHHPFDVVGWDGYYYPWSFNIHDFEPLVGLIHQPPPIHQFLQGDGFVICNFCPRPYDFHPEAVPAPYAHANVMSDEVLYYCSKEFMSRKGIEYGSVTLHPDGLPHGPHPGRYEASIGQPRTDELAVMWDTFKPLMVCKQALAIEDKDYITSWLE